MSKGPSMPVYRFTVLVSGAGAVPVEHNVKACYFQESGKYTVLKDAEHAVVDAYKTDAVLRISRAEKPLEFL
jgi:hypothetical protein